ncbi:MAG: glycoside hydrolase family 30 beta sandwich domain-containing protein [Mangrovibacterium sp.]
MNFHIKLRFLVFVILCSGVYTYAQPNNENTRKIILSEWKEPKNVNSMVLRLGFGERKKSGWGQYSPNERAFFNEVLPSVFERTLVVDSITGSRGIKWIFTGPREGFYIELNGNKLLFYRKYYDSFGYNYQKKEPPRYPQFENSRTEIVADKPVKAITVELNYKLALQISVNGQEVINQTIIEDIRRNQIHLTGNEGTFSGRIFTPKTIEAKVEVNPETTFQQMIGWGGIGTPTAYHELSEAGKKKWWQYINEYNLLCQREYPVGSLLNYNLNNWDSLSCAKAHYYGDNFPNGEVSDFEYNRKIQDLGGFVMFEFWDFPQWIGNNEKEYARAMVGYCREAVRRTGKAPRIVGVQNEIDMPEDNIKRFVPELRKTLDEAGFKDVKIHMANAPRVEVALERVHKYTNNPDVWASIDYGATNMYDYQLNLENPDKFDSTLFVWNNKVNTRPFISPELCVNFSGYQTDSYRVALTMGQLYHKNLTLVNAVLIAYCWTIQNVEQPSFGASRSLFVVSPEQGFIPVASSNQLRVFGAYSRRIKEEMRRVETKSSNNDLEVVAFKGDHKSATMVILNRSLNPVSLDVSWNDVHFTEMEIVDPYSPNLVKPFSRNKVIVQPGAIVTLTNVPLNKNNPKGMDQV